jgi:hypothetical protein
VELGPGGERFWRGAIRFRIYRIENKLERSDALPPPANENPNPKSETDPMSLVFIK